MGATRYIHRGIGDRRKYLGVPKNGSYYAKVKKGRLDGLNDGTLIGPCQTLRRGGKGVRDKGDADKFTSKHK